MQHGESKREREKERETLCLLHVDSLSASRTPVGYRARNHRQERGREKERRPCVNVRLPCAGEPMLVAVGEPYGMVWEGVGSARGRPQAGRTSESWREIVRVVCHEAALENGTWRRRKREERREGRKGKREKERKRGRAMGEGRTNAAPTYIHVWRRGDRMGETETEREGKGEDRRGEDQAKRARSTAG